MMTVLIESTIMLMVITAMKITTVIRKVTKTNVTATIKITMIITKTKCNEQLFGFVLFLF